MPSTHFARLGCGTIFELTPTSCGATTCAWTKSVLYDFSGSDGNSPGGVAFDRAGNLYGTIAVGGTWNVGTLFKLMTSNGSWAETVLHSFGGPGDSDCPNYEVTLDANDTLYGTTGCGSNDYGRVYQWTSTGGYSTIHLFRGESQVDVGGSPYTGVTLDNAGNLYGTTVAGGPGGGGTVFEMSPLNGRWSFANLYDFSGFGIQGPESDLITDAAGNLYGTTFGEGAYGHGTVFKLTLSENSWTSTVLYNFTGGSRWRRAARLSSQGRRRQRIRHHYLGRKSSVLSVWLRRGVRGHAVTPLDLCPRLIDVTSPDEMILLTSFAGRCYLRGGPSR
jgi:uncharacterized repeat protein (TIGR03803 family)